MAAERQKHLVNVQDQPLSDLDAYNCMIQLVILLQAAECGLWGVARNVFEHGLARHPRHALMLEKLVEVVLQLGDWHAASPLIKRILHRCSCCISSHKPQLPCF